MANAEKGETAITVNGREYTLFLGTHEMALLENKMSTPERDLSFWDIMQMVIQRNKVSAMEAWIWASLQKHHGAEIVTLQDAASLIDAAGGILAFGRQLSALQTAVTPDPEDAKELGLPVNPPTARPKRGRPRKAKPGDDSISTLAASA